MLLEDVGQHVLGEELVFGVGCKPGRLRRRGVEHEPQRQEPPAHQAVEDARLVDGPTVSDPALSVSGPTRGRLAITGELAAGQTVTVPYTVQVKPVKRQGDHQLVNFLGLPGTSNTGDDCREGDPRCTDNPIDPPPSDPNDPDDPGQPWLPDTGGPTFWALLAGLGLLLGGDYLVVMARRRQSPATGDGPRPS